VAQAIKVGRTAPSGSVILINLSGRGDKDVQSVTDALRERGEHR
jgi:tryptophan synthase beta subunit